MVDGTVTRSGNRVRIAVNLIKGDTSEQFWSDSYERHLRDVLALQDEIVGAIARQIKLQLTPQEETRLTSARRVNPETYQAYLKGRYHWNKRTPEGLKKGLEHFQQAIELDPGYAQAYAGLAESFAVMGSWSFLPPDQAYPKAKAAATKALGIDDTLAEAHASLATVATEYEWDFSGAEREFRKAIQLNPGYASAHQWYAQYLATMGRHEEARAAIERAHELDPLSLIITAVGGYVSYFAREYDQAIDHCREALHLDSNFAPAYCWMGLAYEAKGMYDEAIGKLEKAVTLAPDVAQVLALLGHAYAVSGRRDRAHEVLGQLKGLSEQGYVSGCFMASIYLGLGEKDEAFRWLEVCSEYPHPWLPWIGVTPTLVPLRDDPRLDDLLRSIGLDPESESQAAEPLGVKPPDDPTDSGG